MRSVVWLKRDLRLHDHRPLAAAADGECLLLYVAEPSWRSAEDFDACHDVFIRQSLLDLKPRLESLGGRLVYAEGEAVDVLDRLQTQWPFDRLLSHQETGNAVSYRRDRNVRSWADGSGVAWKEFPQHGVFRGLAERDGWAARWRRRMDEPVTEVPARLRSPTGTFDVERRLEPVAKPHTLRQMGGESSGQTVLEQFLSDRGQHYAARMSSPVTAHDACSRLSPYLAWGNLSMRQVYQATEARAAEVRGASPRPPHWLKSLAAFGKRLRWHCHFIQKLEDQPSIEHQNMHRACDGLREDDFNEEFFGAWKAGRTGYPMVDACMRALREQKWINFRMRAMLVSFASYHLWLDWRPTSRWLARHFLDYEPGIHYSQFQMQSGTTGINTLRIYSPAKQVLDQDPEGEFIHRWCPELAPLTGKQLANPELLDAATQRRSGVRLGEHYPAPLVDHARATRAARKRIVEVRKTEAAREESKEVLRRHGSRKRSA
jgi:deoxyribodipyrimidine photo-lyase